MGLLTVPKKYNPPGKHTPMEYPALLTRKEMGLLKSMGGAGKKTRWGIPSFVAPPGTNAGIGNTNTNGSYAGGTKSGNNGPQNTNNPGGSGNPSQGGGGYNGSGGSNSYNGSGGNNGPQNQNNPGGAGPQGAGGQGGNSYNGSGNKGPAGAANAPGNKGPSGGGNQGPQNMNNPGGQGPQIGGVNLGAVAKAANSLLGNVDKNLNYGYGTPGNPTPALNNMNPLPGNGPWSPNAYENSVQKLVNAVKPLSPQSPSYFGDLNKAPIQNKTYPTVADNAEIQGLKDYLNTPKTPPNSSYYGDLPNAPIQNKTYPTVADNQEIQALKDYLGKSQASPLDPSMPGQLAQTKLPGYGVPDVPNYGQEFAKTPGPRVNLPSSPNPQMGNINEMLNGLESGWKPQDQIASQISYPSEEGQIYGPASLASYNQPKISDQVPQYSDPAAERASVVNQWKGNQFANNGAHQGLGAKPTAPVSAGMGGPTYGPETPQGPEGWQQGDAQIDPTSHYSPQVQTTASKIQSAIDAIGGALLDNTPGGRLVKGGMWLGDQLSGGPAYRDDVSLGTDESGRRTDRAPSGNSYSPGSFGPGGGDRRGNPMMGSGRKPAPNRDDPTAPPAPPPGTPGGPTVNPIPWYYPQYQSTWANLPTGLGGTYGRA